MCSNITVLQSTGVMVPAPDQVYIADDVDLDRIAPDVTLHPGTRLSGAELAIGPRSVIGADGPVTLDNAQIGADVTLGSGSFKGCTLLDGVSVGPGAHIRPGCLLEEECACGHSVGLKQTVLMPYVVLGSLINFCDCLMAGGTSRANHGEVGSSYVHFNYTPHGDKATPSLMGDVPAGVMLNQPPIFLGGQGGLVGPVRIAYGTIIAAGTIRRRDVPEPGQLIMGSPAPKARPRLYQPDRYGDISRVLHNNWIYLGNLHALREWYRHVRSQWLATPSAARCHAGALLRLDGLISERIKQLDRFAQCLTESVARARSEHPNGLPATPFALHEQFLTHWPDLKTKLAANALHPGDSARRDVFLKAIDGDTPYQDTIHSLPASARTPGVEWLQSIVGAVTHITSKALAPPDQPTGQARSPHTDNSHQNNRT